jgi:hypothetical protein
MALYLKMFFIGTGVVLFIFKAAAKGGGVSFSIEGQVLR